MILKYPMKFKNSHSLTIISDWKCFGCCHVRTATIIVGLWHMAVHIIAVLLFIIAHYITPSYYCNTSSWLVSDKTMDFTIEKRTIFDVESYTASFANEHGTKLWLTMSVVSFLATILLIMGATKKKSSFILPFLILQLSDFIFDVAILAVYIVISSNFSEFFNELYNPPFQHFIRDFGFYQKVIFTCLYIFLALFIKVYLMCVIYSCYQFLINQYKKREDQNGNQLIK